MRIKINKATIFILLLCVSPMIDVLTGFCKLSGYSFDNMSMLYKMLIFIFSIYIILRYATTNNMIYLCFIYIFLLFSTLWHMFGVWEIGKLVDDLGQQMKLFFPVVLFMAIQRLLKKKILTMKDIYRVIDFFLMFVPFSIIIPKILGVGFHTYKGVESGYKGFYYGGNGINILLVSLMLFSGYKLLFKKRTVYTYFLVFINIISNFLVGTKTSFISIIFYIFLLVMFNQNKHEKFQKILIIGIILLFITIFIYYNSQFFIDIGNRIIWEFKRVDGNYVDFITNSRIKKGVPYFTTAIKEKSTFINLLMGIGYTKYDEVVEMDFVDILLHYGMVILGIIVLFYFKCIKVCRSKYLKTIIGFELLYAFFAGHLLISPMGSLSLVLICIIGICEKDNNKLWMLQNKML